MTQMLISLRNDRTPLYQQIYRSLRARILDGHLKPGSKLPASRTLAVELGVSRNVVLLAYENLYAEGYLESRRGSGTYVAALPEPHLAELAAARPPTGEIVHPARLSDYGKRLMKQASATPFWATQRHARIRYDLRYGHPAVDLFPFPTWRRILDKHLMDALPLTWGYASPEGLPALRGAVANYLVRARGLACKENNVIVVGGSQQALDLCARLLVNPGDYVAIEEPGYPGSRTAFESVGARLLPIPVDADGLDVERLSGLDLPVRVAVVTPSHQYPTGAVMSLERRLALITWAHRTGAYVIEDDYDSEFRYGSRPVEAVQGLHPDGQVIYVGTFSKVLVPGLRVAYLVVPEVLSEPFVAAKAVADRHTPSLQQLALADFISQGHFERHIRRARVQNDVRRRALIDALREQFDDRIRIHGADAGVHVLVWFPWLTSSELDVAIDRAADRGVAVYSVSPCYAQPPKDAGLVLGYASLTPDELRAAVALLAEAVRGQKPA